jgi:serine protease Do
VFRTVQIALAALVALAAAAGAAHAQRGPGPQFFGPQYGPQFDDRYPRHRFQDRFAGPQSIRPAASRGWLGVEIQPLDAGLADALQLPNTNGALVQNVRAGGPAAMAGIKAGDVILSVDGRVSNNVRDLSALIGRAQPNTKVTLTLWRQGARQDVAVTLGSMPGARQAQNQQAQPGTAAPAPSAAGAASLGMTIAPASGQTDGVVVASVERGGAAARGGLSAGDRILSVGDASVATTADVDRAVDAARQSGAKNLLMRITSGQASRFIAVPIG